MVLRTLPFDKGLRLFHKALVSGDRVSVTCAEVDYSAGCHNPVTVEYVGRRERFMVKRHVVAPQWNDPSTWESVSVILHCKCRLCDACLKKRRIHWYHRARFETSIAPRTWFGTMTYNPSSILARQIESERAARRKGVDYGTLSDVEKFKRLVAVCGEDVTLYLKRLRKAASGPIRYLTVSEQHESGLPHWHILIHEQSAERAVTHRLLKRCWVDAQKRGGGDLGFTAFKLVNHGDNVAGYVAKYISKDAAARVRASGSYGEQSASSVSIPGGRRESATGGRRENMSLGMQNNDSSESDKTSGSEACLQSTSLMQNRSIVV